MSTKSREVYKCPICGNIVEVLHPAAGQLVCCGAPMLLLDANTVDASREKHVPVARSTDHGIVVEVGSAPHPMTPEHFIEWIEIIDGSRIERCHLKPGAAPQAVFDQSARPGVICRAYCNLHGLWKN